MQTKPHSVRNSVCLNWTRPASERRSNNPLNNKKKAHEHGGLKKKSFSDGIFRPYRKLTFTEDKVDFEKLQSKMDELEAQFDRAMEDLRHGARDAYMAAFTKAAHAGDTQAIKEA